MEIKYEATFEKDLRKIGNKKLFLKVKEVIKNVKNADNTHSIDNIKKLKTYTNFYRIRVGDYRIGIEKINDEIIFTRILHRKEIYRFFP